MKLKHYLSGFGAGVLFATIILSISFGVRLNAVKNEKVSDEQIEERARALGMIYEEELRDESVTEMSTEFLETSSMPEIQDTSETETQISTEGTQTESESQEMPTEPETQEEITSTEETSPETESEEPAQVASIRVTAGMGSEHVSHLLQEAGIIEDENDFNHYIVRTGYSTLIHTGYYEFEVGSSYDAIIEKLCR